MGKIALTLLAGSALTAVSGAALAQQQPAVPEQMPFDIPYGTPIGLEQAKHVLAAAEAEAKKHNWKMNIAVVGPAGELVYFEKMDGAQLASIQIAQAKAHASATFRRPTKAFADAINGTAPGSTPSPATLSLPGVIASEGGFPLVEGGKLIGAIGCSGGTGAQDGVACKAGADMVK